eukprot:1497354-Rhodomonas_salina.3
MGCFWGTEPGSALPMVDMRVGDLVDSRSAEHHAGQDTSTYHIAGPTAHLHDCAVIALKGLASRSSSGSLALDPVQRAGTFPAHPEGSIDLPHVFDFPLPVTRNDVRVAVGGPAAGHITGQRHISQPVGPLSGLAAPPARTHDGLSGL